MQMTKEIVSIFEEDIMKDIIPDAEKRKKTENMNLNLRTVR